MSNRINDQRLPKKMLNQTLFILLASVVLALLVNSLRPGGVRFFGKPAPAIPGSPAGSGDPEGPDAISLKAALEAHRSGDAVFADARPQADYEAGHIKGALHLPVNRFDAWIDSFIEKHSRDTPIVVYCDGAHRPLSQALAEQLYYAGYDNVHHLQNGWRRWREAGGADGYGP